MQYISEPDGLRSVDCTFCRIEFVDAKKGDAQKVSQSFKARPLDRKVIAMI